MATKEEAKKKPMKLTRFLLGEHAPEQIGDGQEEAKRQPEFLKKMIEVLELAIALFLAVSILLGLIYLFSQFKGYLTAHFYLTSSEIHKLLDTILVIFIAVELFRITLAYIQDKNVLNIVVEAAFIAMARKIVLFEYKNSGIMEAVALASLTTALIFAYWIISRKKEE